MAEMIGRRIGNWILERELGRGGMGAVFRARHAKLGSPAAVKALTRLPGLDPELQERFEREAEVHAGLRHPTVARVHDFLEEDGTWFLVMEYLPGGSLADRLEEGVPPPAQAVAWIRQALAGLGHAHAQGVVHRDVKPANLMLDEHGAVKITDFGIARPRAAAQLTSTGTTLGTVQYMSPEQLEGLDDVDHRSDLYAAGAVLYELLAGEPPFTGEGLSQVLRSRLVAPEPPPLSRYAPGVDPRLAEIVHRCLAVDRHERYQSADELRRTLEPFETTTGGGGAPAGGTVLWSRPGPGHEPLPRVSANPARRRRLAAAGAVLASALAVAWGVAHHFSSQDRAVLEERDRSRSERRAELAEQVEDFAREAGAAAGEARRAAERARTASGEAQSAFERVVTATDPAAAARAAEDSARAAQTASRAAESAGEAASMATDAARSARDATGRLRSLAADRRPHPLEGLLVLATVAGPAAGPAPDGGGESYGELAEQAAERARHAAEDARTAAEEARIEAESAHRAATESRAALERRPRSPGPGPVPPPVARDQRAGFGGVPEAERTLSPDATPGTAQGPTAGGTDRSGSPPPPAGWGPEGSAPSPGRRAAVPPEPVPEQPTVAILATGDPVFAAPLEEVLGERLRRAGFDVRDPRAAPGVDRLLRGEGSGVDTEALGRLLAEDGFHVLVVAPVEIGERNSWSLGGSEGSLSMGQIRANAHLLPTGGRLGRGWREGVEYSELNARVKADQALIGATGEMVEAIREGWSGYREQIVALRGGP